MHHVTKGLLDVAQRFHGEDGKPANVNAARNIQFVLVLVMTAPQLTSDVLSTTVVSGAGPALLASSTAAGLGGAIYGSVGGTTGTLMALSLSAPSTAAFTVGCGACFQRPA